MKFYVLLFQCSALQQQTSEIYNILKRKSLKCNTPLGRCYSNNIEFMNAFTYKVLKNITTKMQTNELIKSTADDMVCF